jgi:hypothetical protein
MTPSSVSLSPAIPSSVAPSPEIPSSATLSYAMPLSSMTLSLVFSPSETPSSIMVLTPVTANPVKMVMSALPHLDHHGKENTAANKATSPIGLAKKRKADVKSAIPKGKCSKIMEDKLIMINTHVAKEKETPGNSIAEITATATSSGQKSNLLSHLKDAGYAPPKRNVQKDND